MTVVRAGGSFVQYVRYTSFIAAKSLWFLRYTVTETTFAMVRRCASSNARTFSITMRVCCSIEACSLKLPPLRSIAICPEMNTRSP